jgi:hypothetical protein
VKDNYQTQVRDAIAHSQFHFVGRAVRFLNYDPKAGAHAPLTGMSFDEWYRRFHVTLLLHNETIGAFGRYRKRYEEQALAGGNRLSVRVIAQDGSQSFPELVSACGWKMELGLNVGREGPSQP